MSHLVAGGIINEESRSAMFMFKAAHTPTKSKTSKHEVFCAPRPHVCKQNNNRFIVINKYTFSRDGKYCDILENIKNIGIFSIFFISDIYPVHFHIAIYENVAVYCFAQYLLK